MASKTFKIGECAQGGIIQAEVKSKVITIICKEMYGSKKELERLSAHEELHGSQWTLTDKLNEWTTHFYAEKVMDWIKANSKIKTSFFRQ